MIARLVPALLAAAALCHAEIVDRVAASVGRQAIAESSLLREIRLTAMMNQETPDFGPQGRRRTLERMIDQALIRREMEFSRYPMPEPPEVEAYLSELRKNEFRTDAGYREALKKYQLSDDEFRDYLSRQIATLRFLEIRFRPGIQITEAEIRQYYETSFLDKWKKTGAAAAPSLEEARAKIESILAAERLDQMVSNWLTETRGRTRIEIREQAP